MSTTLFCVHLGLCCRDKNENARLSNIPKEAVQVAKRTATMTRLNLALLSLMAMMALVLVCFQDAEAAHKCTRIFNKASKFFTAETPQRTSLT